jgi:hypothetical protein
VSHFFPPMNLFHHFFQPTFHPEESHAFFCLGVLNFPENRWYLRSSGHHQNRQVKVNCFYWAETVAVKKKQNTNFAVLVGFYWVKSKKLIWVAEHLCHLAVFPVKYLKPSGTGTSKRDKKSGFYHSMLHSLVAQSIIIQWHIRPVNPSCSKSIITIYTHPVYHKLYLLESYIYIHNIYHNLYLLYSSIYLDPNVVVQWSSNFSDPATGHVVFSSSNCASYLERENHGRNWSKH